MYKQLKTKNHTAKLIISILTFMVLLNIWMYLQQPSMVFYPLKSLQNNPKDWMLDYENVTLMTSDGIRLHGWFIPKSGANKTLLFFHGNAGNISHRMESINIFHNIGLNVFIIDYRGYGNSQGVPDEKGLYNDAIAAWQYLLDQKNISPEDIIIFGRSLGGAVASKLAIDVKPAALILESTFTSVRDMAEVLMPVLSRLIIFRYQFETLDHIKSFKQPILILHSPQDEIIPFRFGLRLFDNANQPKVLFKMTGDHNSGFINSQPDYELAINTFIANLDNSKNTRLQTQSETNIH